jgi:hypothetical protein
MWEASDIYAKPNRNLMLEFSCSEVFSGGTYLVKNVDDHNWHQESIKHAMPKDGLFVVRNLNFCSDSAFDDNDKDGEEIDNRIIWSNVSTFTDSLSVIPPSVLLGNDIFGFEVQLEDFPPTNFLKYLKSQQLKFGTTIIYYYHQMWGGNTDIEYAWIFAEQDELLVFKDDGSSYKFTENNQTTLDESVLQRMLMFLDLDIPTAYFALHTGKFNWEKWHVNCNDSNI